MWRVVALLLAACTFRANPAAIDARGASGDAAREDGRSAGWLAGYPYREPVIVTAGAALADFPVSVLATDAALARHALGGSDLVFTAADGVTVLPSEIVAFAQATGDLEAWVAMTVDVGPVTAYLYYGAERGISRASPWTSYAGVWHMNGSAGEIDSTQRDAVASIDGSTVPGVAPGIVGDARTYNGMTDALGTAAEASALEFGTGSFSYEMWVDADDLADGHIPCPLWQGGSSPIAAGYDFQLGSGTWQAEVVDDGSDLAFVSLGNGAALAGTWTQIVGVLDRGSASLIGYADGARVKAEPVTLGSVDNSSDFEIGRFGTTTEFPGAIDEVRVIGVALPAAWIAAEYANLNPQTRGGFIAIGGEQLAPP